MPKQSFVVAWPYIAVEVPFMILVYLLRPDSFKSVTTRRQDLPSTPRICPIPSHSSNPCLVVKPSRSRHNAAIVANAGDSSVQEWGVVSAIENICGLIDSSAYVSSPKNFFIVFSNSTLSILTAARASLILLKQTTLSGSALPSTFNLLPYC